MLQSLTTLLLALLGGPPLAVVSEPPPRPLAAHPSDGPDVDLHYFIDAKRVRMVVKLNLAFVDAVCDIPREHEDQIHPVEAPAYEEHLVPWLMEHTRIVADGIEVKATPVSFEVQEPTPDELAMLDYFPQQGMRALRRVQIILDHPLKGLPKSVAMAWLAFPRNSALGDPEDPETPPVEIVALLSAEGIDETIGFKKHEPERVWNRTGEARRDFSVEVPQPPKPKTWNLPLLSMGSLLATLALGVLSLKTRGGRRTLCMALLPASLLLTIFAREAMVVTIDAPFAGPPPLPTTEAADEIFRPLHANLFRAFDYVAPADVYDQLGKSVDGELLEQLFDEVFAKLTLEEAGGAQARVTAVRIQRLDIDDIGVLSDGATSFSAFVSYELDGRVFHWGHIHERTTAYESRYVVTARPEGWRITHAQPIGSERVLKMMERPAETTGG